MGRRSKRSQQAERAIHARWQQRVVFVDGVTQSFGRYDTEE